MKNKKTKLTYVTVGEVRTMTNALLIVEEPDPFDPGMRYQLRGFGPDPAWPTFDTMLASTDFELTPASSSAQVLRGDGTMEPLSAGYIMKFLGGPRIQLVTMDRTCGLQRDAFKGADWGVVWTKLQERVREFWAAPNFPQVRYLPFVRTSAMPTLLTE